MSDLRHSRTRPESFRLRPDEPEPIRAITGWVNGNTKLGLYRAHLIRFSWDEKLGGWFFPDLCWGVSLCDMDAYPLRWCGGEDFIRNPDSEHYIPEVADMELCMACEEVLTAWRLSQG